MAEKILYDEQYGTASIRGVSCDMGHGTILNIAVEQDGDVCLELLDKATKRRLGEIEINAGASQTPGLAAKLALVIREYAEKNKTE